jgi:hypothetical protein
MRKIGVNRFGKLVQWCFEYKQMSEPDYDKNITMKIVVFWVVEPCNVVAEYQRFGGLCCLHLQDWKAW